MLQPPGPGVRCLRQLRIAAAGFCGSGYQRSDLLCPAEPAFNDLVSRREAKMKKLFAMFAFVLLMLGLCVPPVFAQASGTVKGVCKDLQGNPVADGVVVYTNLDNGQKYSLKTNKKGEYFSLGIASGKYKVALFRNADDAKADKEMFHMLGFPVALEENTLDIDLQKEQQKAAQGQGLTPEQIKQRQEAEEKAKKENLTIKALNEKIVADRKSTRL